MIDFGDLGEFFKHLIGENGQLDFPSIDDLGDALAASGIDVTALSEADLDTLWSSFGDAHQAMADSAQPLPDAGVRFGYDSGPQYYHGMHGRIDVSYDGGRTWKKAN
jgi:hypothetical protein